MIDPAKNVPKVISIDSLMALKVQTSDSYQSGRYAMKIRALNSQSSGAIY